MLPPIVTTPTHPVQGGGEQLVIDLSEGSLVLGGSSDSWQKCQKVGTKQLHHGSEAEPLL